MRKVSIFYCLIHFYKRDERGDTRATKDGHLLHHGHDEAEEPGGGARKEGGKDLGDGHGAEGTHTGSEGRPGPAKFLFAQQWRIHGNPPTHKERGSEVGPGQEEAKGGEGGRGQVWNLSGQ